MKGGNNMKIVDITRETLSCPVYEGDPKSELERVKSIEKFDDYNLGKITMCLHNGTHMDAPLHFIPNGKDVCEVDSNRFIGPCAVVEVPEGIITGDFVEEYFPRNVERVLIKTNGKAFLHESAASALAYLGYVLVGVDTPSIEPPEFDGKAHKALMMDDIVILENLDLQNIGTGKYFLVATPLKIKGAEASPVRAMLLTDYIFWSGDKN